MIRLRTLTTGRSTVGVPRAAEAAVNSPIFGIGLQASYGGLALMLELGWMP